MSDELRAVRIYCAKCGSSQLVRVERIEAMQPVACLACGEPLDLASAEAPPAPTPDQ